MKLAKIKPDAEATYCRSLNLPPHAGYSPADWLWKGVLAAMESKTFPVLENIVGGVEGCTYLLIEFAEVKSGGKTWRVKSHVAAIPTGMIETVNEDDQPTPETPIEKSSDGAWWKEKNLEVVRLVTPWADGFMAFTPKPSA